VDNILRDLFGIGSEQPAAPPAAEATGTATAKPEHSEREEEREARREARRKRKSDPEARKKRDDFVDRYTTGDPSEGFTADEAIAHLQEMREEMSPAEFRQAMRQTVEHLPPDQRAELTAMMRQHMAKVAILGTAAPAAATAAHAAEAKAAEPAAPAAATAADPFGGLLSGLLGDASAGGTSAPGIGDLLSDLQKGGVKSPSAQPGAPATEADFMALINSPLGRSVLGGLAAYGMKSMQADDDDHDAPKGAHRS
jgi:hypothetical protein